MLANIVNKKKLSLALAGVIAVVIVAAVATTAVQQNTAQAQTSICITGGAVPGGNAALVADCETLLGIKTPIRGTGRLNWWAGRAIERWDGISVSGGRVVAVSLSNRGLNGIVPSALGNLSALTTLDLSHNSLTGTIPASLGNLSNLTSWRLAGNSLTGCVPRQLSLVSNNDLATLGLPVCGGSPPPPPPPPPAPPPPPPPPTRTEFIDHCQAGDIEAVHGNTYSLAKEVGPVDWEHNGRGWKRTYGTTWTSETYANVVDCTTLIFDNADSAYFETANNSLLWFLTYDSADVLDHWRIRNYEFQDNDYIPEIGDRAIGIKYEAGRKRSFVDRETGEWVQARFRVLTAVMFRYGDQAFIIYEYIPLTDVDDSIVDSVGPPSSARSVELAQIIEARLDATTSSSSRVSSGVATGTAQEWFESQDTLDAQEIERQAGAGGLLVQ